MPCTPSMSLVHAMVALAALVILLQVGDAPGPPMWHDSVQEKDDRFKVLPEFHGQAVLDLDTRLVWERSPSVEAVVWMEAPMRCARKAVGGRMGWRLPSFLELMTLVSPHVDGASPEPALPTGHPFLGVEGRVYWSATSLPDNATRAYGVDFVLGDLAALVKSRVTRFWCVRGGLARPGDHSPPARPSALI